MNKVVITGIGLVTSLGHTIEGFWENLIQGRSGFSEVTGFDTTKYRVHRGGEIQSQNWNEELILPDEQHYGRTARLALAATRLALRDAQLSQDTLNPSQTGVILGTTSGEPGEIERFNDLALTDCLNDLTNSFTQSYPCNQIPSLVASKLGVYGGGGPLMLPMACAAGNCAIAHASDLIEQSEAEVVLAGGADSFSRITYTGFASLLAIAPERCQPFDRHRKGMIPGEGAAMFVLENQERARARGARIYAEVAGCGITCDAFHMTGSAPDARGAVKAMEIALERAACRPEDIDYISAHGTGTKSNDFHEALAVHKVFGEQARSIPVSSIKSMLGHTMGAASAIETAACCLAMRHDVVPPTMNFEEPDPDCDLDCVPNEARACRVRVAMNNAYAFGGNNASLILRSAE